MRPTDIKGIHRRIETSYRNPFHGDNWHTTWVEGERQVTSLCDGWLHADPASRLQTNSAAVEIIGAPPEPEFRTFPGYPELLNDPSSIQTYPDEPHFTRYYAFGIIALDGYIYQFLSTPNHSFAAPNPAFVGAKLIYSPDDGATWLNQDGSPARWEDWHERSRDNMIFFNEPNATFSLLTVLQMGPSYEYNRDGFVYIYAPNGLLEGDINQLVLARAPKDRILERAAYEYFVARDENGVAIWSSDINERGAVHTFPTGWVNTNAHPYAWHPSVVYNEPLGLYLMVNWGMGVNEAKEWFAKPSYLGFWAAENPWGPWHQIHKETSWLPMNEESERAYQPQIIPAWIAPDGKSFWLIWTDFQTGGTLPYYCFNCQQVEILT